MQESESCRDYVDILGSNRIINRCNLLKKIDPNQDYIVNKDMLSYL